MYRSRLLFFNTFWEMCMKENEISMTFAYIYMHINKVLCCTITKWKHQIHCIFCENTVRVRFFVVLCKISYIA